MGNFHHQLVGRVGAYLKFPKKEIIPAPEHARLCHATLYLTSPRCASHLVSPCVPFHCTSHQVSPHQTLHLTSSCLPTEPIPFTPTQVKFHSATHCVLYCYTSCHISSHHTPHHTSHFCFTSCLASHLTFPSHLISPHISLSPYTSPHVSPCLTSCLTMSSSCSPENIFLPVYNGSNLFK